MANSVPFRFSSMKLSTESFLQAIKEVEPILFSMAFKKHDHKQKGTISSVKYKDRHVILEFMFGPPEFYIEMIIHTRKRKFTFADLLQISPIKSWVYENKYLHEERNLTNELTWFLALAKKSLSIVHVKHQ